MVLVDTNVLAYLLLEGDYTAPAQELKRREPDWRSEALILVEFSNVLMRYMIVRGLHLDAAQELLASASSLFANKLAHVAHSEALAIASAFRTTAYDARFLALARETGLKLVAEDARLRAAARGLTQSIDQALAAA